MPLEEAIEPDQAFRVRFVAPDAMEILFGDGFQAITRLADLGMKASDLKLRSVRLSNWGGDVEVDDRHGQTVHIDSSALRAHVDPQYRSELQRAIAELRNGVDAPPR